MPCVATDEIGVVAVGQKADVLRVLAVGTLETVGSGDRAHLVLGQFSQGELDAGEHVLRERPQHVRLVLLFVARAADEIAAVFVLHDAGVVAGCGVGKAVLGGKIEQGTKLDGLIANNAGVWSAALKIGAHEVVDHAVAEGALQTADEMGNAQAVGYGAGVADVGGDVVGYVVGGGDVLAVAKQAHGNAGRGEALLLHEKSGHGAVNAAAHGNHGGGGKGGYHKYLVGGDFLLSA